MQLVLQFALVAAADAFRSSMPGGIEKVIGLLKDLKSDIIGDGQKEQKLYDKYACWCESSLAEKADKTDAHTNTQTHTHTISVSLGAL